MATVIVRDLQCEVTYTIITRGTDGTTGEFIGPRSFHGNITAGPCPLMQTITIATTSMIGKFLGLKL